MSAHEQEVDLRYNLDLKEYVALGAMFGRDYYLIGEQRQTNWALYTDV